MHKTSPASQNLTRQGIADAVQSQCGLSQNDSVQLVNDTIEHITQALLAKKSVKISGFGVFSVKYKKERPGRNPKTGEPMPIPARHSIRFKPSDKVLKRMRIDTPQNLTSRSKP
jgi:integration host factor subunit alpha